MKRALRLLLPLAGVVAIGACSADARAESGVTYLSPGLVVSMSSSPERPTRLGFGTELSLVHHPRNDQLSASGGYVQAEWIMESEARTEPAASSCFHLSIGPEWSWMFFGLELGLDYRSRAPAAQGRSLGVRAAPYISFGVVYVAAGVAWLPVSIDDDSRRAQGFVSALTIGMKAPFVLSGHLVEKDLCPHC